LFVRDMVARGSGKILITSSLAALAPSPKFAVYTGAKAFNFRFSQAIASELKGSGVTVTALLPDATDTDFFKRADMEDTKLAKAATSKAADVARAGYEAMMKGGSRRGAVQGQGDGGAHERHSR